MDKFISEEIQRMKLLSKYDNSRTLSEQSVAGAPNQGVVNQNYQQAVNASKPKTPEAQIAYDLYWNGPGTLGTDENKILNAIKKIQSFQQYNQVNRDFMAQAKQSIVAMINSEFGDGDAKVVSDIVDHLKSKGVNVVSPSAENSKKGLGGGFFQSDLKMVNPAAKQTTTTPKTTQTQNTQQKIKGTANKKGATPPPQLANYEGITAFQDWLDTNAPGWAYGYKDGKINKGQNGGGYGNFGPRTTKAWATYKDKYLAATGAQGIASKQAQELPIEEPVGAQRPTAPSTEDLAAQAPPTVSGEAPATGQQVNLQTNATSAFQQTPKGAIYGQEYTATDGVKYAWNGTQYVKKA